jgi:1-acyl-sn-glycerol-3-phosphate acyltransferase
MVIRDPLAGFGGSPADADMVPRTWGWLVRLFSWYALRYVRRHFHAVRLSGSAPMPEAAGSPVIVYMNHPAWWDPMIGIVVAKRFFGQRRHYAPMDAAALEKYRFFRRLGFFGVKPASTSGAMAFIRTGRAVLRQPGGVLWLTPQGRFVDVRARPVVLQAGMARLAARVPGCVLVPLAVEYVYWEERFPEALLRFGEAVHVGDGTPEDCEELSGLLADRLAEAQDVLAAEAIARSPRDFEVILGGRSGVGGVYDWWRGMKARLKGKEFDRSHGGPHSR